MVKLFSNFSREKNEKKNSKKKKSQRGRTKTEISSRHSCTAEHAARGRRRLRTPTTAPHIDDDDDDEKEDEDDDDRENTDDATRVFVGKLFSSSSTGWRERREDCCPLRDGVRVVLFVRDERRRRRKTNGAVFYDDDDAVVVVAGRDENANVRARQAVGLCVFFERCV